VSNKGQILVARTKLAGTDHNQYVWHLRCGHCGHEYGANGSDFHHRNCPECQGGKRGLDLPDLEGAGGAKHPADIANSGLAIITSLQGLTADCAQALTASASSMTRKIPLPEAVARIYEAVDELEARYPGRKFTPDGHLVGSIGEVIAAETLGLKLHPASYPGHDAYDDHGDVQIKMIGRTGKQVALYATCVRLVVLKVMSPHEAEIVYDGPGECVWSAAGRMGKNGQRVVSLSRLRALATRAVQHS
jgi:hypothetical protein